MRRDRRSKSAAFNLFFPSFSRIISRIKKAGHKPKSGRRSRAGAPGHTSAPQRTDLRLGRIVRVLMENATVVVSGTKIADEIGIGRSEVWRLVQQLRTLGVEIAGHPQLDIGSRQFPIVVARHAGAVAQGHDFQPQIHHYYKIGSTNIEAMEAASAARQKAASFSPSNKPRGAGGAAHQWHSAESAGIYCSVMLRPAAAAIGGIDSFVGCGAGGPRRGAEVDSRVSPDLKWPNDLLDRGKEILRNSDGDECGSYSGSLHRRRYWYQCEPGEFSRRTPKRGNISATRDRQRMVTRGVVRGFAKIARPRIQELVN